MIVANSLVRRRDDIDLATFQEHWLDPHGPLTARLPRCLRYVQNHVLDVAGTNALARALRIDGIPQLAFASPEDRVAAHGSPELKACDKDSELFIGAVSRVITAVDGAAEFESPQGFIKQILLFVLPRTAVEKRIAPSIVGELAGVRRLVQHQVIEQGPAPGSKVPNLGVSVEGLSEIWLENMDSVRHNARLLDREGSGVASFVVKVYSFI
jgi:uncharacterized protein (TIGR02118 family)